MSGARQQEWSHNRRGAADRFKVKDLERDPTEENPTRRHLQPPPHHP